MVDRGDSQSFGEALTNEFLLAQADPQAPAEQAPAQQTAAAPQAQPSGLPVEKVESYNGAAVKQVIEAAEGKKIILGENDQIDAILVSGDDLIVRLGDGSLILVKGGLKDIPTIVIGSIEVPAPALKASLEAAGVTLPAAGPETTEVPSSGGNFAVLAGHIGDAFAIRDLLKPTEFSRAFEEQIPEEPLFINGNNGVSITGLTPEIEGGDASVFERDLLGGSAGTGGPATGEGSFTISAPDGGIGLTINGVEIIVNGALTGNAVDTTKGRLTVTGFNPATGEVTYTYILTGAVEHPDGQGNNSVFDRFDVVLTDINGDSTSGELAVNIVDDVPTAVSESDSVKEDGPTTADGNVLTGSGGSDANVTDGKADTAGADGIVSITWTGQADHEVAGKYGTLTVDDHGNYTYVLNNSDKDVQGLSDGQHLTETFTYTITDGDGDSSTATLTITINGKDDGVEITPLSGDLTLYEANLPGGSSPDSDALTRQGSFKISAPDGLDLLKVGGVAIFESGEFKTQTITTPRGNTLSLDSYDAATGVVTYTYTLKDNELTAGKDELTLNFDVLLQDKDGSSTTGTLTVHLIDDAPTAHYDADSVKEDGPLTADGNVITGAGGGDANATDGVKDTQGADGLVSIAWDKVANGQVAGEHGTLIVDANGNYTYVLNNGDKDVQGLSDGQKLTDTFTYTITDGDGDASTATLTITINGTNDGVTITGLTPKADGGDAAVDEANLPDGSSPDAAALSQEGTFTISAPDGLDLLKVGGVAIIVDGVFTAHTITTPLGNTLAITAYDSATGAVSYTYTLNDNEDHSTSDPLFEDFQVVLKDVDGSQATDTLSVKIVDDAPAAHADVDSVTEDDFAGESETVSADGNVITGAGGSDANATDGVKDTQGADGPVSIAWDKVANGQVAGEHGTLSVDANGNYTYVLNNGDKDVQGLTDGQSLIEKFTYTITDGDGDSSTATLTITINGTNDGVTITGIGNRGGDEVVDEDDLPDGSSPNAAALTQTGTFSISAPDGYGELTIGGTQVIHNGAVQNLNTPITTAYGTLVITDIKLDSGEVKYEYTLGDNTLAHGPNNNGQNSVFDNIAVQLKDEDGSTANSTLVVKVIDDVPTAHDVAAATLTDDEGKGGFAALSNEGQTTAEPTDSDVAGSPATVSGAAGALFIAGADGLQSIAITGPAGVKAIYDAGNGTPAQEGVIYDDALSTDAAGNVTLIGRGSVTGDEAFRLTIHADGSYEFSQSSTLVHPLFDPANEDDLPLAFNFTVTDKDGDKDSGTLTVTVDDDTPVAGDVTKSGDEDAGQFNLMFIVDNSSSMGRDPGVAGFTTKLDVAKQAIIDAIDKYDAVGDVMVRLVTFNSVGQEIGSTWMSVADAKAALAGISVSNSSTNFEAALAAAQGAYTDSGKISSPDVKNVSFFLSDGNPNPDSAGIDTPAEEAAWKAFLTTNAITSHALGIGTDIEIGNLDPIAYDGATNSDEDGIVVSDLNDLSEVLSGFAEQTLATGNLFTGVAAAASFGADGGTAGLVATGAPNGFTYELSGGKLLVKQGGDTVLTVSLNPTTGAYEIKQSALISHDPAVTSQLFNFTYKLTDGDGDSASGHIAFTLTYDQPVSISGLTPKANGGDATVDEANLADGSAPNAGALTQTGTFTIKADDGIDFLKVGGVSVISGGVFTAQTITTPLGNTLKITAYDSATGVVTYTYTLNDNEQHPAGSAPLFEDFQVQLQDVDGSAASDTLTIRILDDVATAVNDTDSVKEDGPTVATGNVITDAEGDGGKDTAGADGVSIAWSGASGSTVNGTYGTLTVGANGSYSYSLNNNNTAVQGLSANEHLTETFTYTITDSDGDSSTATLTITINGTDDEAGIYGIGNAAGDEVVDEDDLPDGSSPNAAALTQTGTFTIEAKDGYDDLTVGGTAILNNGVVQNLNTPIATTYGQLTITGINLITGVVSYSYVLSDNTTAHPAPGQDSLFDNIAVTLTDVDGSSANSTLIVKVVDDVATASNDADSVKEDGPLTADGNVLTGSGGSDANNTDGVADIAGADGVTIAWAGVSGSSVQGTHGVLTVGADGSYSYALDNNGAAVQGLSASEHLTEIFTYTITDGDGDTSTATLTITINGTDDGVTITGIGSAAGDEVVDEDDLADGSSPNAAALTQTGTFTIEAKDGYDDLTVGGTPIINNGAIQNLNTAISTAYGTLKITGVNLITGVVSYSYVLSDNTTAHPAAGQDSLFDNISVTLTDTDGSSASSTLIVKVIDDVSTANNDTIAQGGENSAITFNAFSNDVFGADGVDIDNSPSVAVTFTAAGKGTVGYNAATGLFTYTPNAGAEGSDSFTYTIKDGDGDTSTATVTVNLSADSKPVIGSLSLVADEDNLATGNHDVVTGDDAQSNLTGNLPISTGNDAIASISFAGMNGTLASFTSKGQPVHYSWNAASNTLIAYTGANPATVANQVFTFQVTNVATGAYVMTLLAAVDQHAVNAADNTETANVSFNLNYVVTDSDGSTGNGTIGVTIDDDVPVAFYPESVFIENVAQGPVTNALNFAQGVGGDGLGDVNFNITKGQAMTDANGNNVQLNGEQVYLHYGSDHHTVIGQTADGDSAFTAILDPANNSYTFDLDGTLYNVAQTSFVNVSGVGGGNVQYKGLGIGTADSHDILISGNGSVNTNATEIGIDGGNDISAGDIARFDMVKNLAVGGANGTGFVHDGHYEVANYIQQVSWVQGGGSNTAGFTVTIRNGDNDFTYLGDATGEGHAGNITVKVFNTDPSIGSPVPVATFTDSDNNVVVTGVKQGQYIEISSTDPFAIVEYSNQTGKSFKLGSINVESANTLDPFDTSLSVTGTDADGDAVNSSINIHLNPDARTQQGDGGNNTLTGTDAVKDILIGMDGDDQLTGAGGDDILAGGSGANTITGGAGNDTIFFDASAFDAADKITDYVAGQDAIDLSDLFTVDTAGGQTLNNYVQMSGTNLQVDANGSTGGSNFTTIATLNTSSPVSIVYHDDTHTTDQTGTA